MAWVLGWATPEVWFAPLARLAFPDAQHVFVAATPEALTRLEATAPFDWVAGYSLGSHLLLAAATRAELLGRVVLLAPIFAFPREKNAGGRVAQTQVRQLARWLRRDPQAALADFYRRAGLDVLADQSSEVSLAELSWGLERLEHDAVEATLPAGWRAWCGEDDALLDSARLRAVAPGVVVVPGGSHHPAALLRAFAKEIA